MTKHKKRQQASSQSRGSDGKFISQKNRQQLEPSDDESHSSDPFVEEDQFFGDGSNVGVEESVTNMGLDLKDAADPAPHDPAMKKSHPDDDVSLQSDGNRMDGTAQHKKVTIEKIGFENKHEMLRKIGPLEKRIALAKSTKRQVIEGGQEFWDQVSNKMKFNFIFTLKDAIDVLTSFKIKDDQFLPDVEFDIDPDYESSVCTLYSDDESSTALNTIEDGDSLQNNQRLPNTTTVTSHQVLEKMTAPAQVAVTVGAAPSDAPKLVQNAAPSDAPKLVQNAVPNAAMAPWISHFKNNRQIVPELQLKRFDVEEDFQLDAKDEKDVSNTFGHCLIGYVAGRFPGLKALATTCDKWGVKYTLHPHISGWTVFKFLSEEDLVNVLEGGPYNIFGMPLILKRRPRGFAFGNIEITKVPVWVNLPSLPWECWTHEALGKIASRIGVPLAMDRLTSTMERVSYARLFVEVDAAKELVEEVKFRLSDGTPIVQQVHYEFRPRFCVNCRSVGHKEEKCKHDDTFIAQKLSRRRGNLRARRQGPKDGNQALDGDALAGQPGGTDAAENVPANDGNKAGNAAITATKPAGKKGNRNDSRNASKKANNGVQNVAAAGTKSSTYNAQSVPLIGASTGGRKLNQQHANNVVTSNAFEVLEDNVPSHFEQCINLAVEKKKKGTLGASSSRPR